MNIQDLLEQMEEIIDQGLNMPLTKKSVVDADKLKRNIEDIRLNLPEEIKQARAIVRDRGDILGRAEEEAEKIITNAEEQARIMIDRDAITKQARENASELLGQAQTQSKEIQFAAIDYVDELIESCEKDISEVLKGLQHAKEDFQGKYKQQD